MEKLAIKKTAIIDAPAAAVWKTLTTPHLIKQWLFGTNVSTDWKKGSPITYSGEYNGKEYQDKGEILEIEKEKNLSYSYWSSMSGIEDKPENYYTVTTKLFPQGKQTGVEISQSGLMTKETAEHSGSNWETVLEKLKEVAEEVASEGKLTS